MHCGWRLERHAGTREYFQFAIMGKFFKAPAANDVIGMKRTSGMFTSRRPEIRNANPSPALFFQGRHNFRQGDAVPVLRHCRAPAKIADRLDMNAPNRGRLADGKFQNVSQFMIIDSGYDHGNLHNPKPGIPASGNGQMFFRQNGLVNIFPPASCLTGGIADSTQNARKWHGFLQDFPGIQGFAP